MDGSWLSAFSPQPPWAGAGRILGLAPSSPSVLLPACRLPPGFSPPPRLAFTPLCFPFHLPVEEAGTLLCATAQAELQAPSRAKALCSAGGP